ncbi:MAG: right-handed parallel beta-helix repeat-containing protein [Armatimonadota bacterium]
MSEWSRGALEGAMIQLAPTRLGIGFVLATSASWAAEYYVAPDGSDGGPGTQQEPLRTIQWAADMMRPGDTCYVREGTYRETVNVARSGEPGRPIRFVAYPGDLVTLSGTEPIEAQWAVHKGSIYRASMRADFQQLFVDGNMMIEARWPNMRFEELFDRSKWATAGVGSRYGKMVDPELAKTGVDWTGALATLNVAHQFFTWTRPVTGHTRGSDTFEYSKDLVGITHYADKTRQWEDDRYYLSGKLEALDSPGEWFLDTETRTLYLWTLAGDSPASHAVEAKLRDLAFDISDADYVELHGFHFFAATYRFGDSDHGVVDNCHLLFPTYARHIDERPTAPKPIVSTLMSGADNTVRNSSLGYSSATGLEMAGPNSTIENCLVHDCCWNGSLRYVAIATHKRAQAQEDGYSVVRGCTVYNTGNASVNYRAQRYIIEQNHVYSGGLLCKDVALVYTGQPSIAGSIVRYNWVHGCRTEGRGGLGIRGDDQTRSLTVHHNVVWDCGRDGIIVKGDHNKVYNNTVLDIGTAEQTGNYISLHTAPEPKKPWRKQFPLLPVQNANSEIFNNAALTITSNARGAPFPEGENLHNNYGDRDLVLENRERLDFRPAAGSPLIDAGREVPGFTDGFKGRAPDIGAYEHGAERWVPGYRNMLWVLPGRDGAAAKRQPQVLLAMPTPMPVTVSITPEGSGVQATPEKLTFTPDNWMRPQVLTLRSRPTSAWPLRLRFTTLAVGFDEVIEVGKIDDRWGVKLPFRTIP